MDALVELGQQLLDANKIRLGHVTTGDTRPGRMVGWRLFPLVRFGLVGGDGRQAVRSAGTYEYICPMPGHAQMGMHGAFIVR